MLSEEDAVTMTRFDSMPIKGLHERRGKELLDMVKHRLIQYREGRLSFIIVHHAYSSLKKNSISLGVSFINYPFFNGNMEPPTVCPPLSQMVTIS